MLLARAVLRCLCLYVFAKAMSVKKAAAIAAAFVTDGVKKSSARAMGSKHKSRDFWRWMKLPVRPYEAVLPLISHEADTPCIVEEPVGCCLVSDFLHIMHKKGSFDSTVFGRYGQDGLAMYWSQEDKQWLKDVGMDDASCWSHTLPIFFHEDGVPTYKDESYMFVSWASLSELNSWSSRTMMIGLPCSRIVGETRSRICDIVKWDMEAVATGIFPASDHRGCPWPEGSERARKAGTPIAGSFVGRFAQHG